MIINFCGIDYDVELDEDLEPISMVPVERPNMLPTYNECFSPEIRMFLKNCIDNAVKTSIEKRLHDENTNYHENNEFDTLK